MYLSCLCGFVFFLSSCEKAKKYFGFKSDCRGLYEQAFKLETKAKRQDLFKAGELCLKEKEFFKALVLLEKLLWSLKKNQKALLEIKTIEKKLANLSFYKIKKYEKAIKYYTDLLKKTS